jgi:hypothetical protein
MVPAVALLAVLSARRYPGERLLVRLADRRPSRRPAAAAEARRATRGPAVQVPRGGLLMGFALAVRPPPGCSAAS